MNELYELSKELEKQAQEKNYFEHTLKDLEDIGDLITVATISTIIVICICLTLFITASILSVNALKRANKNKNKFLKILKRSKNLKRT